MSKYFISIITPSYNRAKKLHRVYESIKSQTLQKIDNPLAKQEYNIFIKRSENKGQIDIMVDYDLVIAKKMHMWGNGL